MGEEGVRALVEGRRGEFRVEHSIVELHAPMDPREFVERCVPWHARDVLIIAGLPARLWKAASWCAIQAAYTYTAEDIVYGTRIRNRGLLFLMNLLGYDQVRDVVNALDRVDLVVVVGPGATEEASRLAEKCGGAEIIVKQCDWEHLTKIARARLERYK